MKTEYEILNVDLGNVFSKARKLDILKKLEHTFENQETIKKVKEKILDGESEEQVKTNAEIDDRIHWIKVLGRKAAADLLTLGKVQPETMFEMSALSEEDFRAVVTEATVTAKKLNNLTIEAEKELNLNTVSSELI